MRLPTLPLTGEWFEFPPLQLPLQLYYFFHTSSIFTSIKKKKKTPLAKTVFLLDYVTGSPSSHNFTGNANY